MSATEKSKKLNKKVIIFGSIGLLLVAAIVIALIVGLGGKKTVSEDIGTDDSVIDTIGTTEDSSDVSDDAVGTDDITDTAEVTEDNTTEDTTATDTTTTQVQDTEAPVTDVNPNGEVITGAGSASQPYLEIPDANMTVTTVSVPARSELYYDIYRVGGMFLTINDPDAYVICDNLQYDAYNGQVYFQVPNALASDSVSFRIGNYSGTAKSFKLIFTNALGSYQNPAVVSGLNEGFNVSLEEGHETGFYFKHYAEKNGVIRFYMQATEESVFIVTNNRNSAQRTSLADVMTDSEGNQYVEIEVTQGDELVINVGAIPNKRGKYPAVEIYWNGFYN